HVSATGNRSVIRGDARDRGRVFEAVASFDGARADRRGDPDVHRSLGLGGRYGGDRGRGVHRGAHSRSGSEVHCRGATEVGAGDPHGGPVHGRAVVGRHILDFRGRNVGEAVAQVPFGTIINAINGKVTLTTVEPKGRLQTITYYGGMFRIS